MMTRCMHCKKSVVVKDPVQAKTKQGGNMWRGTCSICGTKVCRMGKAKIA